MRWPDIVFGLIGLLGFEALRLYKNLIARRALIPKGKVRVYSGIICVLSIFAGACAYALANGNLANALFVGFSVPTGIKALLAPTDVDNSGTSIQRRKKLPQQINSEVEVDEIETEPVKRSAASEVRGAVYDYFT